MTRTLAKALIVLLLVVIGASAASAVLPPVYSAEAATTTPAAGTPAGGNKDATPIKPPDPGVMSQIMIWIMGLFAWLLGVAAVTLDYVVFYTIVKMGDFFQNVKNIGIAWRVLRDIGNIFLIFGFIFAGISVIINHNIFGYTTKMIPMLLVAAVLMNFSLFIAAAVVDAGNLIATEVYAQINNGSIPNPSDKNTLGASDVISREGISNRLMSVLGFQSIYNIGTRTSIASGNEISASAPWYIGFMASIIFLIAAFVFFSLAFILVARFAALVFVIILSPIGFAGLVVPKLKGLADKWWHWLISQTITAPVLLLLLYVALAVITDQNFLAKAGGVQINKTTGNAWTGFLQTGAGDLGQFAAVLVAFILAMGLLLAVVITARALSAFGAGAAIKAGGALSFGAVAWGGRLTAGTAGNLLASRRMMGWATASKNDSKGKRAARLLLRPLTFTGKGLRAGTYDLRNVPGASGLLNQMGINAGAGAKLTAKDLYTSGYGAKPIVKAWQESSADYRAAGKERDYRVAVQEMEYAEKSIKEVRAAAAAGRITPAQLAAAEAAYKKTVEDNEKIISDNLAKLSAKQLEELTGIKQGVEALVKNLSPQQFDALLKSEKLTGAQKDKIVTARYNALSQAVATGTDADIKKQLRGMGKVDLENLPESLRTNANLEKVAQNLNPEQFETIMKSDKYSETEHQSVANARFAPITSAIAAGTLTPKQVRDLSKTDIEYLPTAVLTNAAVLKELSDSQRDDINGSKLRTPDEKTDVRNARPEVKFENAYNAAGGAGAGAGVAAAAAGPLSDLTFQQVARIDAAILRDPAVARQLTGRMLIELQERKSLRGADVTAIGTAIRAVGPTAPGYTHVTGPAASYWT